MKKLLTSLFILLSSYGFTQNTCQTAIPFEPGCEFFTSTPGPVTSCFSFVATSNVLMFEFFWLSNCNNPLRLYTLYNSNCDSLDSNETGDFFTLIPGTSYTICFTLACSLDESITALCVTEDIILPIELTEFKIVYSHPNIELKWITESESNLWMYHIERSLDLSYWNEIGQIQSQGNSQTQTDYSWLYSDFGAGLYYYRLVVEDYDGNLTYSDVVPFEGPMVQYINFLNGYDLLGRNVRIY